MEETIQEEKTKKTKKVLGNKFASVIYTDGSGNLQLNSWGSAYIGYWYNIDTIGTEDKSPFKKLKASTLGFISESLIAQDPSTYMKAQPVNIDGVIFGCIPGDHSNTNNYAEANALYRGLIQLSTLYHNLKEKDQILQSIFIKSDSQMLLKVLYALLNDPDVDVNRYAYPELYKNMLKIIKELKSFGIQIFSKHVYGHDGAPGNHLADRIAYTARKRHEYVITAENKDIAKMIKSKYGEREFIVFMEDYKKQVKDMKTPLSDLGFNKFYIDTTSAREITFKDVKLEGGVYDVLEYDKDSEPGERNGDIISGTIFDTAKEDMITDAIKTISVFNTPNQFYSLEVTSIKHPLTEILYLLMNSYTIDEVNSNLVLRVLGDIDIATPIRPAGLLVQLMDKAHKRTNALTKLKEFLETNKTFKNTKILDITSELYSEVIDKKGNSKYVCNIGMKDKALEIQVDLVAKGKHILNYGVMVPRRNFFKKLEDAKSIKCYLVTELLEETLDAKTKKKVCVYDDYFVIEVIRKDDSRHTSIWNNYYSGKTISVTK